ncbi:hypothetical protein BG003_007428 [Podila horticola]|nr:hypothetical protein BG003_007428 [Podila horticola]
MGLLSYFFAEKPETPVKKEICYFIEIPGARDHRTSPVVWEGCVDQPIRFIGGYDNFMQYARKKHSVGESRNV